MKIEQMAPVARFKLLRKTEDYLAQIIPLATHQVWTDPDRVAKAQEVFRKIIAIQARITGQEPPEIEFKNDGYLYRVYDHFLNLIIRHCKERGMTDELRSARSDRRWLRRHDIFTFNHYCATGPKNMACDNCKSPIIYHHVGSRRSMDIDLNAVSILGEKIGAGTVRPIDLDVCSRRLHNIFAYPSHITTIVETVMAEIEAHREGKVPASRIDLEKARDDLHQMRPYLSDENDLILLMFRELASLRRPKDVEGGGE